MYEKINILAFITNLKYKVHSSVVYRKGENKLKKAQSLGIGYNQYKRYLKYCIDNGLTRENSRGDVILVDLRRVLTFLNDGVVNAPNLPFNRFIKFFHYHKYDKVTFKNIKNQIRKEMVLRNYRQQDYNIRKRNELKVGLDNSTKTASAKAVRLAKKQGVSTEDFQKSLSNGIDNIVSGKNHVANIIEMSKSTGLRLLKSLHRDKVITRTTNRVLISPRCNPYMVEAYKEFYTNNTIIPMTNGMLYRYIGSTITINDIKNHHSLTDAVSRVHNDKNN